MKQKIIVFMLMLSLLIPQTALADEDIINYEETEGYARSFFEHITEYQTIVASKFEDNFNATYEHIENIKATAGQYYDSVIKLNEELKNGEKTHIGVFLSMIGGAYFTGREVIDGVWDYIKGKFTDEEIDNPELEFVWHPTIRGSIDSNKYDMALIDEDGTIIEQRNAPSIVFSYSGTGITYSASNNSGTTWQLGMASWKDGYSNYTPEIDKLLNNAQLYPMEKISTLNKYTKQKIIFIRRADNGHVPTQIVTNNQVINETINNVSNNDYLQNYYPKNYEPKMVLQLTCNNQNLNAVYNSVNDSYYVGQQLVTFKSDGLVYLDDNPCTAFTWKTPQIQVGQEDDIKDMLITDGTGKTEKISNKEYPTPDCDGILCWVSNIWGMVKDLVKAIVGIPMAILNGLVDTVKFLFVPSADSFNGFIDELNTTMSEKFNLTAFTNVFNEMTPNQNARTMRTTSSNTFDGVMVEGLMGTGEVKIIDGDTINAMLPTLHSWIKGFFYVLLAFFNINHMYKLIRGTTIFESMRGKGE